MKWKTILTLTLSIMTLSAFAGYPVKEVGEFTTPLGQDSAGPAFPGQGYEFEVTVRPNERLHFASMYGVSNDWFFGTYQGIRLAPREYANQGEIHLFDAGTEVDENINNSQYNGPNQAGPMMGPADPVPYVRELSKFEGLKGESTLKISYQHLGDYRYKVKIAVKESATTAISPGVFWVQRKGQCSVAYKLNGMERLDGLEAIAEDGNHHILLESLRAREIN